jgi:hypothetical protein
MRHRARDTVAGAADRRLAAPRSRDLTRALALLVLLLLALLLLQRGLRALGATPLGRAVRAGWRGLAGAAEPASPAPDDRRPVELRRCTGCGVHVPVDETRGGGLGSSAELCRRCRASGER